jgi:hypothetical protein
MLALCDRVRQNASRLVACNAKNYRCRHHRLWSRHAYHPSRSRESQSRHVVGGLKLNLWRALERTIREFTQSITLTAYCGFEFFFFIVL